MLARLYSILNDLTNQQMEVDHHINGALIDQPDSIYGK
jgi:hypothetical protein